MVDFLTKSGCDVIIWDPYVSREDYPEGMHVEDNPYEVENIDILVLATGHSKIIEMDWLAYEKNFTGNPMIYDGRRVLDQSEFQARGWFYTGVGVPI